MTFDNKLVAVLNKDIESGVALNSMAHMAIGFGAELGKDALRLDTYKDADGNAYPDISQMPFIILRGRSTDIRKLVAQARELQIRHSVFLDTMTGGTYVEQLARTAQSPEENLVYYGCTLYGPWETVSTLTKKLSLWR